MPPRLQPLTNRSDGSSPPIDFVTNQIRPEGRAMRPVRENMAVATLKAELQKNSTKAAKAKATREANSARTSHSAASAENDASGQGPPLNGHCLTLGGRGSSVSMGVATTPTPMFNHGQPVNFQSQAPPFHWAMGGQHSPAYNMNAQYNGQGTGQMSLLEELNNPNVLFHPGQHFPVSGEQLAVLQTRNMNQDQGLGLLEVSMDSTNKNMPQEPAHETEVPWPQHLRPDTELEPDASGDDEDIDSIVSVGPGIKVNSRSVSLKPRRKIIQAPKLTSSSSFDSSGVDEINQGAATTIDEDNVDAGENPGPARVRATRSLRVLSHDCQQVIKIASDLLRKHLTKINPWADTARRQLDDGMDEYSTFIIRFWYEACSQLDIDDCDPTPREMKRITERTPQFRGQVRDKAKSLVVHLYNFIDTQTLGTKLSPTELARIKTQNRETYVSVKDTFYFKNPNDKSIPNTMYQHPIIQNVLNMAWFGEGTFARSRYFAEEVELPLVTIAFILTAIENALDAWKSGRYQNADFSSKQYQRRYAKHLNLLQMWKDFSAKEPYDLATELQVTLLENARLSIGETPEGPTQEDDDQNSEAAMLAMFAANQPRDQMSSSDY